MKIKSIKKESFSGTVYNFSCLPDKNYFSEEVLVHNCYKSNSSIGKNMSLETYKTILEKFTSNLCQVAFGIGSIDANPDLQKILEHTREKGITPNITVNGYGMTDEYVKMLVNVCGAAAVSAYGNGNACIETVKKLYDESQRGGTVKQVNIHKLLAQETISECFDLLDRIKNEAVPVNAVVFLLLKPKGKRNTLTPISDYTIYKQLMEKANDAKVGIGMDSCSAPLVLKNLDENDQTKTSVEPCESGLFSLYINVDGDIFPCSFCEETANDLKINMLDVKDFMKDVWFSSSMRKWRHKLLTSTLKCSCIHKGSCRACPVFDITPCLKT
jgi:radical SAM protein with 4Fe4S-binding SPASM domain